MAADLVPAYPEVPGAIEWEKYLAVPRGSSLQAYIHAVYR